MMERLALVAVEELNYLVEKLFSEREEERRKMIREFGINCFFCGYRAGCEDIGKEELKLKNN